MANAEKVEPSPNQFEDPLGLRPSDANRPRGLLGWDEPDSAAHPRGFQLQRPINSGVKTPPHRSQDNRDVHVAATQRANDILAALRQSQTIGLGSFKPNSEFGSLTNYAATPDGKAISQLEFAERYLMALDAVTGVAQQYLHQGLNFDVLRTRRAEIVARIPPIDRSLVVAIEQDRRAIQQDYERGIRARLVELSYGGATDELELRGIDLAILALSLGAQKVQLATLLQSDEGKRRLSAYRELISDARKRAGDSLNGALVARAFCELVKEQHGYYPALRYYSDFDGKLTHVPESGSPWKPGEQTNALLNHLDSVCSIPLFPRLVLTEHPGLDARLNALATKLYGIAADESVLFSDAPDFFSRLQRARPGVEHTILTANHTGLVSAKLERTGLICDRIIGVDSQHHYPGKPEVLLTEILTHNRFALHLMGDDNDGPLAEHLSLGDGSDIGKKYGVSAFLGDLMVFAVRASDEIRDFRMVSACEASKLPHLLNCRSPDGNGLHESIEFLHDYSHHRDPEGRSHGVTYPVEYLPGRIVQRCRDALAIDAVMPKPTIKTIITPIREIADDNWQYDLGVPSAVFDPKSKSWVVYYKSANGPSGNSSGAMHSVKSNVFVAKYCSSTDRVVFLNPDGEAVAQRNLTPFLESSLPKPLSTDGFHDPRVTYLPELEKHFLLGCAFNKAEEQTSMIEAGGDVSKPIRGAVTELFEFSDGSKRSTYRSLGQFGPDFHFKNMVLFPKVITVDGTPSLLLMTRKMPGIQIFPVAISQLELLGRDKIARDQFWGEMLSPDSVARHTVLNPALPYEGFKNPNAPGRKGQLAPGLPPVRVNVQNALGGQTNYWLVIYNSVPDFMPNPIGSSHGRVISAALLDYDDPWQLVSRSPLPIIAPRSDNEVALDGIEPRHADVAFTGGGGIDDAGRLVVFYTEGDTIIRAATWDSVTTLTDYLLRFDHEGRERKFPSEPVRLAN